MSFALFEQAISKVKPNYTLEILMLSYENPSHMATSLETFRHGCCERDAATPCDLCDNAFRVCVRERATREIAGGCDLLKMESTLIEEDNDNLTFTIGQDIGGLSNPILVSGELWHVSLLCEGWVALPLNQNCDTRSLTYNGLLCVAFSME